MDEKTDWIIFPSVPKISPAAMSILSRNVVMKLFAIVTQSALMSAFPSDATSLTAASIKYGAAASIPFASSDMISMPLCTISSALFDAIFSIRIAPVSTPDSSCGAPLMTFATIGIRFPVRNVNTVSVRASSDGPISSPSARFPSTFVNAAFIEDSDPDNVLAASFAVVPVISRSSCITWIALYTSDRLSMLYSTPESFLASASNLSISDFVPPYPSFKLSSIV